jgi:hypothetical protein
MYFIKRAYNSYSKLTSAQRTSSLFREEPIVLGKTLRRGSKGFNITDDQYKAYEAQLMHLVKAGAIEVDRVDLPEPEILDNLHPLTPILDLVQKQQLDSSEAKVETAAKDPVAPEINQEIKKDRKGKGEKKGN